MSQVLVTYGTPERHDIEVVRNTDVTLRFVLTDPWGGVLDLTADTVQFTAYAQDGTTKIATKSNAAGSHTDATGGVTTFTVAQTEIDDEADEDADTCWVYEVRRIVSGNGAEQTLIVGELRILAAIPG